MPPWPPEGTKGKKAESHNAAGPSFPHTSFPSLTSVPLCSRRLFGPQSRSAPPNSSRAGRCRTSSFSGIQNRSKRRKQRKKAESHCAAGPPFPRTSFPSFPSLPSLPSVPLCRRRRFDPQSRSAPPNSSRAGRCRTFLQQFEQKQTKETKEKGGIALCRGTTLSSYFVAFCSPLPSPAIRSSIAFGAAQLLAGGKVPDVSWRRRAPPTFAARRWEVLSGGGRRAVASASESIIAEPLAKVVENRRTIKRATSAALASTTGHRYY